MPTSSAHDFSTLFSQLLSTYCWLLPLLIVATLFKPAWFKGFMGETMVNIAARLFLNKHDYHLIKNVTIPTEDGTTQIDHIIVSRFGVFVVELESANAFRSFFGLKLYLEKVFDKQVDLGIEHAIKPAVRENMLKSILYV